MAKPFYVYILKCSDGSYYTGHTDDIEKRFLEHQSIVYNCYTAVRQPIELVFIESMLDRNSAFEYEHQIKRWSRKKKEALIERDWKNLSLYAKKHFDKDLCNAI